MDWRVNRLRKVLRKELQKDSPDFKKVRQIVLSNKDYLLDKPIGDRGEYVLHYLCWKKAPLTIVTEFIHYNPSAVQQKDSNEWYPLHYACRYYQSESVIELLVKEYPLAVQKVVNKWYPLHYACLYNQSASVIQLLVNEYPLAIQQKDEYEWYPLHYACLYDQSESVIQLLVNKYPLAVKICVDDGSYPIHLLCQKNYSESIILTLIDTYLLAVKQEDKYRDTPLDCARRMGHSETIIKVLESLMGKSDYELENRIDIPTVVLANGLENRRRYDIFKWILLNP